MHSEVIYSLLQERKQLASTPNKLGSRFNVSRLEEVNGHIRTFSPHVIEWPERFQKNLLYHASCYNSQEETEGWISRLVEDQRSAFSQILAQEI